MHLKINSGLLASTYYIFIDIGCGIGPYIFSFARQNLGYKAIYQICAWLIFIVLILYFFLIYKRNKASFLKKIVIINFDL